MLKRDKVNSTACTSKRNKSIHRRAFCATHQLLSCPLLMCGSCPPPDTPLQPKTQGCLSMFKFSKKSGKLFHNYPSHLNHPNIEMWVHPQFHTVGNNCRFGKCVRYWFWFFHTSCCDAEIVCYTWLVHVFFRPSCRQDTFYVISLQSIPMVWVHEFTYFEITSFKNTLEIRRFFHF